MDRASIESLYRKHGPMVLRRARTLLGDEQAAQDAMQEVFIQALREGAKFRGEASPSTWLYRVTTNHCLNLIRDGARRRDLLAMQGPPEEAAPGSVEDRLVVSKVLAEIPESLREIAVYYFVDQMNQDEIAALLGLSRRTIGNRLEEFRALAQRSVASPKASAS